MQGQSLKITRKAVVGQKQTNKQKPNKQKKEKKRFGRFLVTKQVKGIESNLDKFQFPPQILVS